MCLFWKAEKIALKNSVKNCGGVLSRTFSWGEWSSSAYYSTKDPISRLKGWRGEFSFMLKKMLRWWWCFRNEEKTSQRSTWLIKEALVFFPDQSFLYENTGFSSIFFWMGSRIKLSPPQDEISFVKDLDMSIKSVKAQKRHLFHQFLPFKSSLFFFICFSLLQ